MTKQSQTFMIGSSYFNNKLDDLGPKTNTF